MKSRIARARAGGSAMWGAALMLAAGLSGCNPIEGYRSLAGLNKNDPDPATTPFTQNLDSAQSSGYPNLAGVPAPPIVASTVAERAEIVTGLNAQRTSLTAPDKQGHPGSPAPGPVPPPPPIPPELVAAAGAAPPAPVPAAAATLARRQRASGAGIAECDADNATDNGPAAGRAAATARAVTGLDGADAGAGAVSAIAGHGPVG